MSPVRDPQMPQPGAPVTTACGGTLNFNTSIPHAYFQGELVYFCLPACLRDFGRDPNKSCLQDNLRLEN